MTQSSTVMIAKNSDLQSLRAILNRVLETHEELLPKSSGARILLKPNFNSNMNALTGNTTDLRIIVALVERLQARGYRNIVIGEGTNSGFYRNNIDVASRLRVTILAKQLGVEFIDLNYCSGRAIEFTGGETVQVAEECLDADLFVNLPKLKMHHEVGVSVCLKNMMGCLIGQQNKKKTHQNLARNILRLNQYVKPHIHIVDGLIAMEGNGPSDGLPVRMDTIVAGTDPVLIDMVCAELVGMPYQQVTYLKAAEECGLMTNKHKEALGAIDLSNFKQDLLQPNVPFLVRLVGDRRFQRYFQLLRHAPGLYQVCNTSFVGNLFLKLGIRQEHFIEEEMDVRQITMNRKRCRDGCRKCTDYCPLGLSVPSVLTGQDSGGCIKCLYCYMVCPQRAINVEGTFGFVRAQLAKYDDLIRKMA